MPDVWLTLVACFRWKPALVSGLASLVGALIGGAVMATFGARAPEEARAFLERIPAIHGPLVVEAHSQLDRHGLWGLMLGPLGGVPYKIYAVEWGARHGSLASFLVASVPARYVRFLLSTLAAAAIAGATAKLTGRRMTAILLWATFWVGLYVVYFTQHGVVRGQ